MGSLISRQIQRTKDVSTEERMLHNLYDMSGAEFPGSRFRTPDRKNWMPGLDPPRLPLFQIVWPGTHDSATDRIGVPFVSHPLAKCHTLGIYDRLVAGTRVLDIRVQEDRRVCHGILSSYSVDVVLDDMKKFLSETKHEIVILEVRRNSVMRTLRIRQVLDGSSWGVSDSPGRGEFMKTISDLAPKRIICVWKPRKAVEPQQGSLLWSAGYLRDNWIDTDMPLTKFNSNMEYLRQQPDIGSRKYLYRVENTVTPQSDSVRKTCDGTDSRICKAIYIPMLLQGEWRSAASILDRLHRC